MDTTINEFYLNKVYEDLHREKLRLMNDCGIGGQSAYSSLEDYKHTVNGKGLANKLEKLVMKEPTIKRPKNIRLNF